MTVSSNIQQELAERPKRKSVAFSEDTQVVDANGDVTTEQNGTTVEDGNSAESHASMFKHEPFLSRTYADN